MFGTIFSGFNQNAVNNQQLNFNKQLVAGAKTGDLNEKEFMNLATYDQGTRKMEGEFLKDGYLSFSERKTLEQRNRQNQEMLNLYKRGDYFPETQAPQNGIEARMQNQLRRTYHGLEGGSLTYGEGVYTMNRQGEVATNYGKAQATPNGFWNRITGNSTFTAGERQDINRQLNANSHNLYDLKHNWSGDGGAPMEFPQFPGYGSYNPPMNFPRYPAPPMMNPGPMPQFPGGTPSYMSSFTQGMFAGMQMMQMMMMMQMMGMGMPLEMFGGGMPMGMNPFMGMGQQFPLPMFPPMGMGGNSFGMGGINPYGGISNLPYNAQTGNALANTALAFNGTYFKPGQTCRCADFVSTMIERSGQAPPGFRHEVSAAALRKYGQPVGGGTENLKPGDVVFFGNTYRPGATTHVGIYIGDGKFVHRPTADRPVKVDNINSPYWKSHYTGGNRLGVQ